MRKPHQNEHRKRRIAAGICTDCPNPAEAGKVRCSECLAHYRTPEGRARVRKSFNKWRARKKAEGLCLVCGKVPVTVGTRCEACRQRHREYCRAAYEKRKAAAPPKEKAQRRVSNKESQVRRRERLRAAGLCTRCGKNPTQAFTVCGECRQARKQSRKPPKMESAAYVDRMLALMSRLERRVSL